MLGMQEYVGWITAHPSFPVDRKLNLLVQELQITIAEIQGVKWFGCNVWHAGNGWCFLHSSWPLSSSGEITQCDEGVGVEAQHAAGDSWHAVPSRIVVARLKLASAGQWWSPIMCYGHLWCANLFLAVICVCTPTFKRLLRRLLDTGGGSNLTGLERVLMCCHHW